MAANPGAVVVTVTAGRPPPGPITDWDRRCGFHQGDDVVGARRAEDERALRHLDARPVWLDFLDHQYHPSAPLEAVVAALEEAIAGFDLVASPLGLGHEDHLLTAVACEDLRRRHPEKRWILYEDVIYRMTVGGTDERLTRLRSEGFDFSPLRVVSADGLKRETIAEYASQVIGLGELLRDAHRPERYWTMTRNA